jgi:hypothetical protein
MKTTVKLAAILSVSALAYVSANAQVLNFVGLANGEPIENYYNGGLGGFGSGPGPNYGITFASDSLAIISQLNGGTGNFQNAPSDTAAFFLTGPGDTMNVAAGFTTGFSFYYASGSDTGSVSVYSGLNGTGTVLGTINLAETPSLPDLPTYYNDWFPAGIAFGGTAESAVFSGVANYIGFDDIDLGSPAPPAVPDNTGAGIYLLGAMGLAGAAWASRKQMAAI